MTDVLFVLYSAAIPLVPLWGINYYRKNKNTTKKICCWILFLMQILISFGSIISYLGIV